MDDAESTYLELWKQVLDSVDPDLAALVDSGLATQVEKVHADALDALSEKHDRVVQLRHTLKKLDAEYAATLSELGAAVDSGARLKTRDTRASRIADFLQGLVVSFQTDFSRAPDLEHVLQQVYLFVRASCMQDAKKRRLS